MDWPSEEERVTYLRYCFLECLLRDLKALIPKPHILVFLTGVGGVSLIEDDLIRYLGYSYITVLLEGSLAVTPDLPPKHPYHVTFRNFAATLFHDWLKYGASTASALLIGDNSFINIVPDYTDMPNLSLYDNFQPYGRVVTAFASVGCSIRCSFCKMNALFGNFHRKDRNWVIMELSYYVKHFDHILFTDALVNPSLEVLEDYISLMELFPTLTWSAFLQVMEIPDDILRRMVASGFLAAAVGVESLVPSVREKYGKKGIGVGVDIPKMIKTLDSHGIDVTLLMIVADEPFQSQEEYEQELIELTALQPYARWSVGPLMIFPNADLLEQTPGLAVFDDFSWQYKGLLNMSYARVDPVRSLSLPRKDVYSFFI